MKFGKSLSNQIEKTQPQWRDKFLSYKELKKKLKLVEPAATEEDHRPAKRPRRIDEEMSKEEIEFRNSLENELHKFNAFFLEEEEECIIKLKELKDNVAKVQGCSNEQLMQIRKEIVDFHGEMVLLENYSALNYTGLVKILKKYDKRTGALIRLPFIQKVLQQPFFTTDLLYKLVKECETMLDDLFPAGNDPPAAAAALGEVTLQDEEGCDPSTSNSTKTDDGVNLPMESLYMKSTISALHVLQEIRSGSSTVSMFSLPPLQINGLEETCAGTNSQVTC